MSAEILCYKNQGIHWYHCNPTFLWKINFTLVRRLILALIWDISGLGNRSESDGRDFREKRIGISRFLTPYIVQTWEAHFWLAQKLTINKKFKNFAQSSWHSVGNILFLRKGLGRMCLIFFKCIYILFLSDIIYWLSKIKLHFTT